jgi:hypothetical protein
MMDKPPTKASGKAELKATRMVSLADIEEIARARCGFLLRDIPSIIATV